jgi:hypothetical protein
MDLIPKSNIGIRALNFRLIVGFFVHRVAYEQDPGKRRKRGSIFFRKKKVRKHPCRKQPFGTER